MSTAAAGPTHKIDASRAEAFAGRVLSMLNDGFLSVMVSIGHQTGLFDAMAMLPASGSDGIARATKLSERYVREWLSAMVAGGIIDYEAEARTYRLPPEHAGCLTRAAGTDNLASLTQLVTLMAEVEQPMLDVFRKGGGLPYSAYRRFHALMAEDSRTVYGGTLVTRTVPLIDGLKERLESGIDVVDVGCGQGAAMLILAERFPNSRFSGIDFESDAIDVARRTANERRLANLRFETRDAATLAGPPAYDFITAFDAIHDQAAPRRVLRGIRESLRPGGVFLMVDIGVSSHLEKNVNHPLGPMLYTCSTLHCTSVSLSQGGEGLGACWGREKARELLGEAGFSDVGVHRVEGDILNDYFVCRA